MISHHTTYLSYGSKHNCNICSVRKWLSPSSSSHEVKVCFVRGDIRWDWEVLLDEIMQTFLDEEVLNERGVHWGHKVVEEEDAKHFVRVEVRTVVRFYQIYSVLVYEVKVNNNGKLKKRKKRVSNSSAAILEVFIRTFA